MRHIFRIFAVSAAGCMAFLLVGCGGDHSTTSTTSNDDIAAFIEENPEYADSGQATARPSKPSSATPLGLDR